VNNVLLNPANSYKNHNNSTMLTSPFSMMDNRNSNLSPQAKVESRLSGVDGRFTSQESSSMSMMPSVLNGELKTQKLQDIRSKISNMFDIDFANAKVE